MIALVCQSARCFGKLMTVVRREVADEPRRGRPWSLPLEDRVLLVAAYWRTNLTLRQYAPLFGVSKSAANRIIDHLGPSHKQVGARIEHAFARMKCWRILRDCRLKGDGVHHAMLGIARLHNLNLAG
ncbi:helix-turn-helix domain-containing protein [Streptomyces sp. cg35]|uniref:helix-turn-helix domain-containing protein n=1 Tax=Streptomyces sp. cg35 TaxID=3421650 RepID=UPI003D16E814